MGNSRPKMQIDIHWREVFDGDDQQILRASSCGTGGRPISSPPLLRRQCPARRADFPDFARAHFRFHTSIVENRNR